MPPGSDDASHPGGQRQGTKESKIVENDDPADFVGVGGDVALHVRKQNVDGDAV